MILQPQLTWPATDTLMIIWKSLHFDTIKQDSFQVVALSVRWYAEEKYGEKAGGELNNMTFFLTTPGSSTLQNTAEKGWRKSWATFYGFQFINTSRNYIYYLCVDTVSCQDDLLGVINDRDGERVEVLQVVIY